ncbi:MAG: SDR family NAD(P)-dependent oxidoreductase [Candidatus Binataceae bacterium]
MNDSPASNAPLIAVLGMAGRFPGARNVDEFWRNLRDGVESISPLDDYQLRTAGVSRAELANPNYVRAAAILDDFDRFDAAFFGFSPKDAAIMDPQHRLFLECAWGALDDAGWCPDELDGRIGVYAGSGMNSYLIHNLLTNPALLAETGLFLLKQTGNDKDALATRVSYQLNLTGPSLAVQTACSTSLVAIHLASQSLLNRECDMALARGVTIEVPHGRGYIYREREILSRDGHCRAFDAASSGTIFGSGIGIVALRRLDDALRDGDRIRAVIRGTAINNDGARKVGYFAPSVAGQAEVVAEALAVAGVPADSISYIEAHGTGTAVGDPIELAALNQAFRETTPARGFCAIGSVKTNLGHLDAAADVTGFIKTVLALEHRQLPPSLNFVKPNPLIDFASSPFFVNTQLRDWDTSGTPRRAGVTALGIGGTNAHIILEESPTPAPTGVARPCQLLTLSAKTPAALDALTRNLADHLADRGVNLADDAYTGHFGRKALLLRRALVCHTAADAAKALYALDPKSVCSDAARETPPSITFLFPGQGSQYVAMGQELYRDEPVFRAVVDSCAEKLQPLLDLDLRTVLFPAETVVTPETNTDTSDHVTLSFNSLLYLSQALGAADLSRALRLAVVSNSLEQLPGETSLLPERALLTGPCLVVPKEIPNVQCRHIDLKLPAPAHSHNGSGAGRLSEIAVELLHELRGASSASPVVYRDQRRWVRTFEPLPRMAPDRAPIRLRERGVYLITGGLGGIGLTLAEALAQAVHARLVLLGRSAMPPRETWDEWLTAHNAADPVALRIRKLRDLERAGVEVLTVTADVTDLAAMRQVVAQAHAAFGEINGVIHAAGVLADAPLLQKTGPAAARVIAPKLQGTLALEAALAEEQLDFLVLMSSVSSLLGPAGQVDYTAANAFLDAFARALSGRRGYPVIAIQWPHWREVGMAADIAPTPTTRVIHPLLREQTIVDDGETVHSTTLNVDRDWIVGEHRLHGGPALFPGRGYIEMIYGALSVPASDHTLTIKNLYFTAPLAVRANADQALRLTVRKEGRDYRLSAQTPGDQQAGEWLECAQGEASVRPRVAPGQIDLEAIRHRCSLRALSMGAVDDRYGWDLGWGRLAQAGVDVHEVTSDHLRILREPSVRELAREIAACLQKCRTAEEHSSIPAIVMSAQFERPSVGAQVSSK